MIEKIKAHDIRKQYNSRFALECSLEIQSGLLYTIVGPNGSGKSTLLRILGLLERPDSGSVLYCNNGESVSCLHDIMNYRRKAVLVPTKAGLFNETVFDNAAYGLKLRNTGRHEIRERVMNVLRDVGLNGKEKMNARELSSGEAQRLALARAFAIDPDVLFLDEPTSSLDPENTKTIENIIADWRLKPDKIIVIVTHSLPQARALSDRVIFMYKGKIEEFSDGKHFFENPSTVLARKFVFGEFY